MTEVIDADAALRLARFDDAGLLPAVVQEAATRDVLMVGWMDREALRRTLTEGRVVFWSRSRQQHWRKGDTSGHVQHVRAAALDCDADTLLVTVDQVGPACHTGAHACFDVHPVALPTTALPTVAVPPTALPTTALPATATATAPEQGVLP